MKAALATLLGAVSLAAGQVVSQKQGEASYSVHVPKSAGQSGSGDVYFQIKGPTSMSWVGFGQGSGMVGSNIFVMYADSSKKNVTLSPRYATGHEEPQHDSTAKVTLLEGSGIQDGSMVANVRCTNCNNWGTGSMKFNDPSSSWIWAWKQGDFVASDSLSAEIEQHDDMGVFTFDLTKATGGTDSTNPFVTDSGQATTPSASSSGASDESSGPSPQAKNMDIAHGTLMGITMVLLFPFGAALRRLAPTSSIWVHAGVQAFAWVVALAGMGVGIKIALATEQLMDYHPIIGLVVVCVMSLQPALGLLQHSHFRKNQSRGVFGWVHKALGIALILLGMINGGLGLQLADNSTNAMIAYGVIAGVIGVAWLVLMGTSSGRKRAGGRQKQPKTESEATEERRDS